MPGAARIPGARAVAREPPRAPGAARIPDMHHVQSAGRAPPAYPWTGRGPRRAAVQARLDVSGGGAACAKTIFPSGGGWNSWCS